MHYSTQSPKHNTCSTTSHDEDFGKFHICLKVAVLPLQIRFIWLISQIPLNEVITSTAANVSKKLKTYRL